MESYNKAVLTQKLFNSPINLFHFNDLKVLFGIASDSSLKKIITALIKSKVLLRLEKDVYLIFDKYSSDYTISNFIYQPSYLSLETALNFHGILSQIPYELTAITTNKQKIKNINHKIYSYSHIQSELFWGYEKVDDFLIAQPEKAILDQAYFYTKGLRQFPIDEYDMDRININLLRDYLLKFPNRSKIKSILVKFDSNL
jgi:predicted transcriptional regulator of viral defense system